MAFRVTAGRLAASLFIALGTLCTVTDAQATNVDVQLVLAADASGSIDDGEHALQRIGYAQALRDPRVLNAIRGGSEQAIAVTYVEWTGRGLQMVVVPWTVIKDADSAERVAQQLLSMPRGLFGGGTAVGEAIYYSASLFEGSGFESERKVIDVSGDGPTNQGRPAAGGRDFANDHGITVNGLPILTDYPGLDVFYEQNVIGGPGAFMVPAMGFHDFAEAVLHKLIREVAGAPPHRDLAETTILPR
jgi:hypothetical protein